MSKENEIDNEKKKQEQNVADKDSANAQGADNTSEAKADKEEPKKEESAKDAEKKDSDDKTSKETELQKQIDDLKDRYLREVAEFDNYKKRTLKEKAELILNGGEKTITAILPILDDLERALADKNEDAKAIKEGMDLIYKKFIKTLEGLGVKKIDTKDKDFDTDNMEAIAMVPGQSDDKKGKVIDCVQTGYTLNEKVIRHAKVAVGQ